MKKLLAVILSFVILVTSMGFTVSSHMCGGKRVKTVVGIIDSDVSCGMEIADSDCGKETMVKSNCCQDEFRKVQMDEDYTQEYNKVELNKNFAVVFIAVVFDLFSTEPVQKVFYSDYSPPPLVRDIPVLIQSFLI